MYQLSKDGYINIADLESLSTVKYLDSANVHTIGLGSTQSDIPGLDRWSWDKEITIQYAFDRFKYGLEKYIKTTNKALEGVTVEQHQFDALVCTCYNIGQSGLLNSTIIKRIRQGHRGESIRDALIMWTLVTVKGKKVQSKGLVNRRTAEWELFNTGVYPNKTDMIKHFEVNPKTRRPIYSKYKLVDANQYL